MSSITFLDFVMASIAESDSYKEHARIKGGEREEKERRDKDHQDTIQEKESVYIMIQE